MKWIAPILLAWLSAASIWAADVSKPDFNADVRPILSKYCFKCHGPDDKARKAQLRLDIRENPLKPAKSGEIPIVPGHPDKSEFVKRIFNTNEEDVMPPPATKNQLLPEQKEILKRWIAAGAEYQPHWAFIAPKEAALPEVKQADWCKNPIDRFILAKLESEGLHPSPPADRYALVRRVYLDLIGLPPTPEDAENFVKDTALDAYDKLVDRLLASPQYGERWARRWLDLARYADTNGYEKDRQRSIWPFRDWVINALNADMPFDQFTVQQIAGDMLPNPTTDNVVATGFHRNTMLNEEGGIDPLEFRYYSMVDRVSTTGKTWLGLTLQCAQCHTHKFDPITHREYYQIMAFLNNVDEPEYKLKPPDFKQRAAEAEAKIETLIKGLPEHFPLETPAKWTIAKYASVKTESGEVAKQMDDGSWLLKSKSADKDIYTIEFDSDLNSIDMLRLEVLNDDSMPHKGPGRAESGNFVLTEVAVSAAPKATPDKTQAIKISKAEADFSQTGFVIESSIDGNPATGWGIAPKNSPHNATFTFAAPIKHNEGAHLSIKLIQQYGTMHTIGRFRLNLGQKASAVADTTKRKELLDASYAKWLETEAANTVHWTQLKPVEVKSDLPLLTVLDDLSIYASGDHQKTDTYDLKFKSDLHGITAIRLEVLPDERLPAGGPGRTYYEGAAGDFSLSEFSASAGDKALAFSVALQSYAHNGNPASNAIDGKTDTNWTIDGGQGKYHTAIFKLSEPLVNADDLKIKMFFERHFCASLGRFRISVTTDPVPASAHEILPELESALLVPAANRTQEKREKLFKQYLLTAPELAAARRDIENLKHSLTAFTTTLVLAELPPENPRVTFIHNRGEYLQPTEKVDADVLKVLNPLPANTTHDRLAFARWLVSPENPLTARVTVNRAWAAFFGRGIVKSVDDFGYQSTPPSHPALLDWLAVEFVKQGWSQKKLHKLIVMSATYAQSSRVTPELLAKDSPNILLARAPRVRLDSEQIRDSILRASNLLTLRVGGPSVFPPQPANITTEGAYGKLSWNVSSGPDRYRRGLYTFSKRTAPYAMFGTFDGPSGESCIAQRETSNSPLQALTMLNDGVILEAAQTLGREFSVSSDSVEKRIDRLVRQCLTRPPTADEVTLLRKFVDEQTQRFEREAGDAKKKSEASLRAWTALARAVLNLDEMITKG